MVLVRGEPCAQGSDCGEGESPQSQNALDLLDNNGRGAARSTSASLGACIAFLALTS